MSVAQEFPSRDLHMSTLSVTWNHPAMPEEELNHDYQFSEHQRESVLMEKSQSLGILVVRAVCTSRESLPPNSPSLGTTVDICISFTENPGNLCIVLEYSPYYATLNSPLFFGCFPM